MGNLRRGHIVETGLWLGLVAFLFFHSFEFDREIEIYRYGAAAWPRAILILMALAAIGQFFYFIRRGDAETGGALKAASDDGAADAAREAGHASLGWYLHTLVLLIIPFVYINLPKMLVGSNDVSNPDLNRMKLICAAVLVVVFFVLAIRNQMGAMLALPVFFAAMLQDIGFYALALPFIIGVMFLMGERRASPFFWVPPLLFGLLLALFVKVLYVGLPTGYIRPFYDFGNWVVSLLQ